MSHIHCKTTVTEGFFQPLHGLVSTSPRHRPCREFPDQDFLHLGIQRVVEMSESGRAFLQEHGVRFPNPPTHTNYFNSLNSVRRQLLLEDVALRLETLGKTLVPDRLADIPELSSYECFAGDGHWHKAAAHDEPHRGTKMAVGHFYSLDLRTHMLRHLAAGQGLHEHDMSALKRIKPKGLRHGVAKGRRVLIIYDKAAIDFAYWKRCRQECAVYFISRAKENFAFDLIEVKEWNRLDPRNAGVTADHRVMTREGHLLRLILYTDPRSGESFEFLTNEPDLPPGVIVELYRRRWEAEKVFDEIKNKLGEKKAWCSSLDGKTAQARLIAITHNLLMIYESKLEKEHGITNVAENKRRQKRREEEKEKCAKADLDLSPLVAGARRATQRSVKFIRWIRQSIRDHVAESVAVLRLRTLYAQL